MIKKKQNKVGYMAAALALAMAPVPATSLGYSDIATNAADTSTTLQALQGSIAYLPINDATSYIRAMADRLRFHLKNIRSEWEEKQRPIEIHNQSPFVQKHLIRELEKRIDFAKKFISAVSLALKEVGEDNHELRNEIVTFGRAVASLRYIAEDFLSFIEQTHPPKEISTAKIKVSADDVKAMIRAEHQSLGLEAPAFDKAV
ncbi:Uncharacterised protein [Yersinia enterocolitica]|uniref:hypothetical protein n=1 Tax=Yersinia enterocolitica TaxID=630 RepID=UPI000281930A|nr:hypothetical protein [Yersinia enterocolitica]AJI84006.1 hypothetical protein CH47_1694 [Yersinia enterocolitica]EKA28004.1 hypothetical protein YWA314_06273 [Yersinia enterocolitica subsp. enterocolitica WA-314]KGA70376.1 hypothetical protein DJ59_281 [Yersinia enterocolitica]KGA78810.1 hypothetical protein DJ60_337 [Yersinia enterocolitica]MCE3127694.1 hypothetical protein [Yersinia enterocolitica]